MANNRFITMGKPAQLVAGPTPQYLPATGYLTNSGHQEIEFLARRHTAGTGTLDITMQQFEPAGNYFVDCVGGNNAVIKFSQWLAAAADAADTPRRLRVGVGITAADPDGVLPLGTAHQWFDYTPPQFWRLKLVESATGSLLYLTAFMTRG